MIKAKNKLQQKADSIRILLAQELGNSQLDLISELIKLEREITIINLKLNPENNGD